MMDGGQLLLAFIAKSPKEGKKELQEILVIQDFLDVFLAKFLGLLMKREIEFSIKCIPGTVPMSKAPYMMAPT